MDNTTNSILGTEEQPLYTPTSEERTLAILSHILTVVPGIGFIAPLVIYLLKNQESAFVGAHSKESLNFQITVFFAYLVALILIVILIGVFLLWAIGIINVILVVVATVRASENKLYRYPFNLRLIK
jgi:uncharacterized Tic20 family protein